MVRLLALYSLVILFGRNVVTSYVIVESQDLYEASNAKSTLELCKNLASSGSNVEIVFVQNAVLGLRGREFAGLLAETAKSGVKFHADLISLQARGIRGDEIPGFVVPISLDLVIDAMADGKKMIWH